MTGGQIEILKSFVRERQNRELVIFGAGHWGGHVIGTWFPHDGIKCIYDNNPRKWGKSVMGIPVRSPDELREKPERYVVVIAVNDHLVIDSIRKQLQGMGIDSIYHFSILKGLNIATWRYGDSFSYLFHEMNTYKVCRAASDQIAKVREMLCDERSVEIYDACVEKLTYNISDYTDIGEKWRDGFYFDSGVLEYGDEEVFVDGGAFDGSDAIRLFNLLGDRLKKAYLFEPDKNNYDRMRKNINGLEISELERKERFSPHNLGLYSSAKNFAFMHWGNYGSKIIEDSDQPGSSAAGDIAAVRLDDVAPESEKITFIKLDVEGAEIAALNGARGVITRNKPKMALSAYHRIEDLWEIPLLVKSMVPDYKLFFRQYGVNFCDKVLYATL